MNGKNLRRGFLDYFFHLGHRIVPSSSLLPDSPNLLFTNAGMNQFVPFFLGHRKSPDGRLVDVQKCIRAGGKHNDLEDVGRDTYHHTFFEMLGNWSMGDYFKRDAIVWAWCLLTEVWKLPKERFYATVYRPGQGEPAEFDREAFDIWREVFLAGGMEPEKHICYGDAKANFWMMGETGPCGPCTEIHVDLTPDGDGRDLVNSGSPRCMEIWNLVFIQFNAQGGRFEPLSDRFVDTGLGLERLAGIWATTQGFQDFSREPSNYESDLFRPYFSAMESMSRANYHYRGTVMGSGDGQRRPLSGKSLSQQEQDEAFRVVADHVRALTFAIGDGILPGNEGRNYVVRRILRRALMFGDRLLLGEKFLSKLSRLVVEQMGEVYPELRANERQILAVLNREEDIFSRTLQRGSHLLQRTLDGCSLGELLTGSVAFELYDTYGFPLDLTQLLARERGFAVDLEGFERRMEAQRRQAKEAQKKSEISLDGGEQTVDATTFLGYENDFCEATILSAAAGQGGSWLIFDRTPFYAEKGGQVADRGIVQLAGKTLPVEDVQVDKQGHVRHFVRLEKDSISLGEGVILRLDSLHRRRVAAHHSATHLIQAGLRHLIGDHVRQMGSYVSDRFLRFDFSHFEPLAAESILRLENWVNEQIWADLPVRCYETDFEKKPEACLAHFGEKYGAVVRVVEMGAGVSVELCGGTHVASTGRLGLVKILSECGIAAGVRRLEAVASDAALELVQRLYRQEEELSKLWSCSRTDLLATASSLQNKERELLRKNRQLSSALANFQVERLVASARKLGSIYWVFAESSGDMSELRELVMKMSQRLGSSLLFLVSSSGERMNFLASATGDAVSQGFSANDLVRLFCELSGGRGGGRPDFASGGGSRNQSVSVLLDQLRTKFLQNQSKNA